MKSAAVTPPPQRSRDGEKAHSYRSVVTTDLPVLMHVVLGEAEVFFHMIGHGLNRLLK